MGDSDTDLATSFNDPATLETISRFFIKQASHLSEQDPTTSIPRLRSLATSHRWTDAPLLHAWMVVSLARSLSLNEQYEEALAECESVAVLCNSAEEDVEHAPWRELIERQMREVNDSAHAMLKRQEQQGHSIASKARLYRC